MLLQKFSFFVAAQYSGDWFCFFSCSYGSLRTWRELRILLPGKSLLSVLGHVVQRVSCGWPCWAVAPRPPSGSRNQILQPRAVYSWPHRAQYPSRNRSWMKRDSWLDMIPLSTLSGHPGIHTPSSSPRLGTTPEHIPATEPLEPTAASPTAAPVVQGPPLPSPVPSLPCSQWLS